jgi:hypothetical protein
VWDRPSNTEAVLKEHIFVSNLACLYSSLLNLTLFAIWKTISRNIYCWMTSGKFDFDY